ncbi:MAG: aminoglycoside phosphotransferase family protein [Oscillospiraceae bacterium]|nr:aminoglycoside phosphotransferase family protein [Oscillospiraceae bacterium]
MNYNINIPALCDMLELGRLVSEPKPLSGGLLHKMFDVETELGRFAVKALNPNIMERPKAYSNYIFSEETAEKLSERIAVSCAKKFDGKFLNQFDGQYYIVYDFIEGQAVLPHKVNPQHAYKIGEAIGEIHNANTPAESSENEIIDINWHFYCEQGKAYPWHKSFAEVLDTLCFITEKANGAFQSFSGEKIVCHRDMDSKNVLWQGISPIIIDWESAGAECPQKDFIETALYWSQDEDMSVRDDCFTAFAEGYKTKRDLGKIDLETLLYSCMCNKLEWLEYNLKRSMKMECTDETEQKLGTEQVLLTIGEIKNFYKNFDRIIELAEKISV